MKKFTINKKKDAIIKSKVVLIDSESNTCFIKNKYNIIIQKGQSKYINFINSGYGADFIGVRGIINKSTEVSLIVNGDNTGDNLNSGSVTLIIRDKKNGTIENIVTLTRKHNNTFC